MSKAVSVNKVTQNVSVQKEQKKDFWEVQIKQDEKQQCKKVKMGSARKLIQKTELVHNKQCKKILPYETVQKRSPKPL